MPATVTVKNDQVLVTVSGGLNYGVWRELREGREAARAKSLPLCIDIRDCTGGDLAGLGSVQLAQERLPQVKVRGCNEHFKKCFDAFGICDHCSVADGVPLGCTKRRPR